MASNPFLKIVLTRVKAKGGWSVVLERIAAGEALNKIAKDYECSRHTMYKLLHKKPQLWQLFEEARRESAMAMAEEATDIADDLASEENLTREDVALAKLRIEQRRWLAAAYDRETFGVQQQQQGAALSIGELHLAVLQAPPTPRQIAATVDVPVTEALVLEESTT